MDINKRFEIPYISKKPNPNAGNQVYYQQLGPTPTLVQTNVKIDGFDHRLSGFQDGVYTYTLLDREAVEAIKYMKGHPEKFLTIKITKSIDVQKLYSLSPEGSYLYEYDQKFRVQCQCCGKWFSWTELENDSYDCDYEYTWTETKCPKCGEWDCCIIGFQK